MSKPVWVIVIVLVVIVVGAGWASRGKVVDLAADEVIKKFQGATCEQLKAQKDEPPTMMKKAADLDAARRTAGARGLHRQDRRTRSEQDDRVRHGAVRLMRRSQ